ncbi:MAG: hypothetical protein ABFD83_08380 [Armatimonadota bacterium]
MTRIIIFLKRIAIAITALALCYITPSYADTTTTDALGIVTDVIVGHGNKGPYFLSWTRINSDTVTVVLSGRTLRKSADYNIDSANGMISFNANVLNDAILRVSYSKTSESKSNSTNTSVPLTVGILQRGSSNLNVTGLYIKDSTNSEAGDTVLGVGGDKSWSGGKVESTFLMSQKSDDTESDRAANMDSSALKLSNTTNLGGLKLTGSYAKAGKDFAGSKQYGLTSGQQNMSLSGNYGLGKLQTAFKFQNADQTAGTNEGVYSRVNEQTMTYAPTGATKVSMAHSTTQTGNTLTDDSDESAVETSKLQLEQKIGAKTSTALSVTNTNKTTGETTDQIQTKQASVTTNAVQGVSLQGTVTQKDSQTNGAQQDVSAAVTLAPISQVDVKAAYTETDSETSGQSATTNLSVKLKPVENVVVEGKIVNKTANEAQNYQRDFSLSAAPIKNAKLTAQFSQKGENETDAQTKGAALEVSPFDNVKMSAGYKQVESSDGILTIHDYAAMTSPWKFLSMAGSLRDRQMEQDFAPDTRKLNLSLAPFSFVKLIGDYQENPEDTSGSVQKYKATTMGMKFTVGSVGLMTNYTSKDKYSDDTLSDEREVKLEVPAFGHGKMQTGYKIARTLGGSEISSNTYSLGYEHSLGSDFSLSLTGYYLRYMQDQVVIPEESEYKTELNLGIKF